MLSSERFVAFDVLDAVIGGGAVLRFTPGCFLAASLTSGGALVGGVHARRFNFRAETRFFVWPVHEPKPLIPSRRAWNRRAFFPLTLQ